MCNLSHPVTTPNPNAGTGGAPDSPDLGYTVPGGSGTTTMQPTKFAKLLKVVSPMIQGGLAGAGSNPRQAGGGAAAQSLLSQQREFQLQKQALARQTADDAFRNALESARTQHELNIPPYAVGANTTYTHLNPNTGERDRYKNDPYTNEEKDLGPDPTQDRHSPLQTDQGIMDFDSRTGEAKPVTNMAPEETGSLPLGPGQEEPTLRAPVKQQAPIKLSEGEELIDPVTHEVTAKGAPKQFAPRAAKTPKVDPGKVETYAGRTLDAFGGDVDKAIAYLDASKDVPDAMKPAVRARMRERAKPAAKRKFQFSQDQMQKMANPPAGQ